MGFMGVLSVYFRKIYTIGSENIPKDGPLIICGNHANQFIDPMMILTSCDREISFTMAASSYSKPVIGQMAKCLNVIPVYRPEDAKIKGKGKIVIRSSLEIEGIGTDFQEFAGKSGLSSLIVLGKTYIVDKVLSDKSLLLKEEIETIKEGEHDYFLIPKIDNSLMFKSAYDKLSSDGCICIFPEGTSHDRTDFLKLKAGIALMTLGAMSEGACKNVRIVPAGLNYFKRDEFRSEVIIEFGKPFEVPHEWANEFKINKRNATEKLLKEIEARMKAVTLTAPSYQELRSVFLVRKLYVPPEIKLTPTQYTELCKRFVKGYEKLKDQADTLEMLQKVNNYVSELENTGLHDFDVKKMDFTYAWFVRRTILYFILLHIYIPIVLPAFLIGLPFALIIRKKAERERIAAKLKNPNKIEALDVVGSVKIVYSIIFLPIIFLIWMMFFILLFNYFINGTYLSLSYFATICLATFIFPGYIYISARMLDKIIFYLQTMKSRVIYFGSPRKIIQLRTQREILSKEVLKYVNVHIRDTDPKYANDRILFQDENILGVDEADILIKRNSRRKRKQSQKEEVEEVLERSGSQLD